MSPSHAAILTKAGSRAGMFAQIQRFATPELLARAWLN
jgi:hypothetical protein